MTAAPMSFLNAAARRFLRDAAGEPVSLGTLAAELDLAPPEAVALLFRLTLSDPGMGRAAYVLGCDTCGAVIETVTGPAAWALAGATFSMPCACGSTSYRSESYLDLLLYPAECALPGSDKRVAESSRVRAKSVESPIATQQLSLDFGDD